MRRLFRFSLVIAALVAFSWAGIQAQQTGTGQKPPDTAAGQKPPEKPPQGGVAGGIVGTPPAKPADQAAQAKPADAAQPDLPADFKAFNAAAGERDPQKRIAALEKFIADNQASQLVGMAKTEIQQASLGAYRDARKRYLDAVKAQIETAKAAPNTSSVYSTYNRYASEMFGAGGMYEEAEEYSRTGLSLMDEQKYITAQKQQVQDRIDAYAKRAAGGTPAATPSTAPVTGISMGRTRDGLLQVRPLAPRPDATPPRPPSPPTMPTDDELRAQFRSQKASAQAVLGQILLKRDKTDEAEKVLKEAYAGKLTGPTLATVARTLAEMTKKSGDDKARLDYLSVVVLSGRYTAADRKDLEATYAKTHGGSADGLEAMLDERWRRDNPKLEVAPVAHKASAASHAVVAELFSGSG